MLENKKEGSEKRILSKRVYPVHYVLVSMRDT